MDLPYPTYKNNNFSNDLNQLDKLARSILMSTRDIPKQDAIHKSIKSKILRAITCDNARKLYQIVQKQVLKFTVEIGTRGSLWNILHFCAKNNAHQCIQYVLKAQFQQYEQEYKKLMNSKTVEGYTPLMVAIINRSHKALQKILWFGGVDIHVIDQQRMSPIEIAINYKNDKAIRSLANYDPKTKRKDFINKEALSAPLNFPSPTYCQSLTSCLLRCFTFGLYDHDDGFQFKQDNKIKVSDYVIEQQFVDYVPINSRKELQGYDIEWKRAYEWTSGNPTVFKTFDPFQIRQINFSIGDCLIIFQCLSQQSWILKRAIKADNYRNNNYKIILYPNRLFEIQTIDDFIPFIKQRKQPMFLANNCQMWPMLLQKALAKLHNSYFALRLIQPINLLQQITGFPTVEMDISPMINISFLQNLAAKNYPFLLKGKKGSDLCQHPEKQSCFTVINFCENDKEQLVLINCPFISQKWKQKASNQPLHLKILKSHFNTHQQMCIWIEAQKLKDYFSSIIISMTFQNYQRSQAKVKTHQFVFFKFKIQNKREDNIFFQLTNSKTKQIYNLSNMQVIKNEQQLIQLTEGETKIYNPNLAELQCLPGQYMCFYQTKQKIQTMQTLLLLSWAPQVISTEIVEPQLGILQWFGFLKNHFCKYKSDQQCVLEVIGEFSLILFRENAKTPILLRINIEQENIIEGRKDENSEYIQMIKDVNIENIHYCVVKRIVTSQQIIFDYKKQY